MTTPFTVWVSVAVIYGNFSTEILSPGLNFGYCRPAFKFSNSSLRRIFNSFDALIIVRIVFNNFLVKNYWRDSTFSVELYASTFYEQAPQRKIFCSEKSSHYELFLNDPKNSLSCSLSRLLLAVGIIFFCVLRVAIILGR